VLPGGTASTSVGGWLVESDAGVSPFESDSSLNPLSAIEPIKFVSSTKATFGSDIDDLLAAALSSQHGIEQSKSALGWGSGNATELTCAPA